MAAKSASFDGASVIQANHDEAFMYISQGLSYDEQNQSVLASEMYEKGLSKIDASLNVRCDRYCMGPKWDKARAMQEKLRRKREQVKNRLEEILCIQIRDVQSSSNEFRESPPTYNEACAFSNSPSIGQPSCPTFTVRNDSSQFASTVSNNDGSKVNEMFHIPGGVQLFFISSRGLVNAPSSLNSLHIYELNNGSYATKKNIWLQVGSWKYPLVAGQSTVLESSYGAFIFPDTANKKGTASVGVILPAEVDFQTRKKFEGLLQSLIALTEDNQQEIVESYCIEKSHTSDTVSNRLVIGAEYISFGLVKGATIAGEYIHKGATVLIQHLHPEETPAMIDQRVKDGVKVAKSISSTALAVSGFLVGALCDLTISLGNKIAPYVREQGVKFVENAFEIDKQQAKDTVDGVMKVAAGGIQGVSTIYLGLHDAAGILARSLCTETVKIVGHKYGTDAKDVVDNTLSSIGNLAMITRNVRTFGAKAIVKRTAKDTGKAVLQDFVNQSNQKEIFTGRI